MAFVNSRDSADITSLLKAFSQGDESAREELMSIVYQQLRAQARRYMRGERSTVTMQSTGTGPQSLWPVGERGRG